MKKEKIIDFCNSLGLDTIGFIKCRRFEELEAFFYERKRNTGRGDLSVFRSR